MSSNNNTGFDQKITDGVVQRLIKVIFNDKKDWVRHSEIVKAMLSDSEASYLIQNAMQKKPESFDNESQWASNMIAWFSRRITEGNSDWGEHFERTELQGKWAYKPTTPTTPIKELGTRTIQGNQVIQHQPKKDIANQHVYKVIVDINRRTKVLVSSDEIIVGLEKDPEASKFIMEILKVKNLPSSEKQNVAKQLYARFEKKLVNRQSEFVGKIQRIIKNGKIFYLPPEKK